MGASSRWRLFMSYVSFEGTDAEGVLGQRWVGRLVAGSLIFSGLIFAGLIFASLIFAGLILSHTVQKSCGWYEEKVSGDGAAEVEQAVVVAGRAADEHIHQHLLDGARGTAIADEIGAKFAVGRPAEGHVVAENLDLFSVLNDGGESAVRGSGLDGIVQLDIGKFSAADDALLGLGGDRIPCVKVVKIFLHDDITTTGER